MFKKSVVYLFLSASMCFGMGIIGCDGNDSDGQKTERGKIVSLSTDLSDIISILYEKDPTLELRIKFVNKYNASLPGANLLIQNDNCGLLKLMTDENEALKIGEFDTNGEATLRIDANEVESSYGDKRYCSVTVIGRAETDDNILWEAYYSFSFVVYNPILTIGSKDCFLGDEVIVCTPEIRDGSFNQTYSFSICGNCDLKRKVFLGLYDMKGFDIKALKTQVAGKTIDFEVEGDERCYLSPTIGGEKMKKGEILLNENGVGITEIGITEHGDFKCNYEFSYGSKSYEYILKLESYSEMSN